MSDEIKNCPCCGGEAELSETDAGFLVWCVNFECGVKTCDDWTKKAALDIWNNRTGELQ